MKLRRHGKHEMLIWDDDMRREAFRMMDEGLTAKKVGDQFGVSKSAILGQRFRYYDRIRGEDRAKITKTKAVPLFDPETHRYRKCLTCKTERVMEKQMFICNDCKAKPIFSSMVSPPR
jgi:hypothetical protein